MLAQQRLASPAMAQPSALTIRPRAQRRRCSSVCSAQASASITVKPSEAEALKAYRAQQPVEEQACLSLLRRAARDKSVAAELVEGAIVHLEQIHKPAGPAPSIVGSWHLVFGTAVKVRAFQYLPIREDFVIGEQRLALESAIGPFSFHVKGAVEAWRPNERALDFQFDEVDVLFLGSKVWQTRPSTKPKTYTWFYVSDDLAVARSSAGGLALLRRDVPAGRI